MPGFAKPLLFAGSVTVAVFALGYGLFLADRPVAAPIASKTAPLPDIENAIEDHDSGGSEALLASPDASRFERFFIGQGGTLAAALDRLQVPVELRPSLLETAGRHVDLRRLSPQTGVVARVDDDGTLHSIAIRSEPERFLRISLLPGTSRPALRAELLEIPVRTAIESTAGLVTQSVGQALSGSPHGRFLTAAFADVFQWDVDLLVDPRPGDVVRVVYEVQRLGALPADLPSFGNAADEEGQFLRLGKILAATYDGEVASANAFWVGGPADWGSYYDDEGRALQKSFLKSPLNYRRISSGFSRARRHPVTRRVVAHHGVDFAASRGTPVVATADGRVVSTGWEGPLGRAVRLRHGSEYVTVYGHLSRIANGIGSGVEVRQNQVIGYVGSTGRATGPHLHYTVLRHGKAIDPMRMKNPPAKPLPDAMRPWLADSVQRWNPLLDSIEVVDSPFETARGDLEPAGAVEVRSGS